MDSTSGVNFGFVIDNRKCIGCHACTVACKSEHDVPVGVNRTHVKYIEKGTFPDSTREFSVLRCNHCEDAPCVEICPTIALFTRDDGIVDFDNARCIGCRSCMQACPYDALYIDPNSHTAAKCNYCAHRIEGGFEPACVIVCPVEAIISGDLNDPNALIARTVKEEKVTVRKPHKGTIPNVYYVDTGSEILDPASAPPLHENVWSSQARGVGHYAKYAKEKLSESDSTGLLVQLALEKKAQNASNEDQRIIADVMGHLAENEEQKVKRVYDAPSKGVLWGWQLPAYIWTKAMASGLFFVTYLYMFFGGDLSPDSQVKVLGASLSFLFLTGALLVFDLDRPERFLYVLLRPNWSSWLVKGAYIILFFGGVATWMLVAVLLNAPNPSGLYVVGILLAGATAIYTAFLLAQAKGRDLWGSPWSALHMLIHGGVAGAAGLVILVPEHSNVWAQILLITLVGHLLLVAMEIFRRHPTADGSAAVEKMTKGSSSRVFYFGIGFGGLLPMGLLGFELGNILLIFVAVLALVGIYCTEFVRIRAPQLIPLS